MFRIPIPVALATVIVASAVGVYFLLTVVSNPTLGAWTDQGPGMVYTYSVPGGGWVMLGTFGGSSITITSNVTIDIRADAFTAQVWANTLLPAGTWDNSGLKLIVYNDTTYELRVSNYYGYQDTCTGASVMQLSSGMYMYYPDYTAPGASCKYKWPFSSYTIDSSGYLRISSTVYWPYTSFGVSADRVTSYTIKPPVYSVTKGSNTTMYYIYWRPVYGIWVRPSANANITVTVNP